MNTLNPVLRFGLVCGVTFAIYVVVGRFLWDINGYNSAMKNISSVYINYSSSGLNSLIFGALWAFLDGFIAGSLFSWLRSQLPYTHS